MTVGAVNVPLILSGADSFGPVLGLSATNTVPEPSSLIVAVPVTVTLLAFVAASLNVSPPSSVASLVIGVRTSKVPVLSRLTLPLMYGTHLPSTTSQYSRPVPVDAP